MRKTRTGGHYRVVTEGGRPIHNEEDEDWRH